MPSLQCDECANPNKINSFRDCFASLAMTFLIIIFTGGLCMAQTSQDTIEVYDVSTNSVDTQKVVKTPEQWKKILNATPAKEYPVGDYGIVELFVTRHCLRGEKCDANS